MVKFGFFTRDPTLLPNCLNKPLKIQRYQCKNKRGGHFLRTFSFSPFPMLPRIGIPVNQLLKLVTDLLLVTWSVLQSCFPDQSLLTIGRWRKRAADFLDWLKSSSILAEPHLTWARFQFAFSRHSYPPRAPP